MMSNKLWEDIFFYTIWGSLGTYFASYYVLRRVYRNHGKSVKNLVFILMLCMMLPAFGLLLIAPGVPFWVGIIVGIALLAWATIGWRIYVRNYNSVRRSMGLREWDWDWGGPKQDNHDVIKDNKETSATEKK